MGRHPLLRLGSLALLLLAGRAAFAQAPRTTDSAGIKIRVSDKAVMDGPGRDAAALGAKPSLEFGSEDGDEPYLFHRVGGAMRLADGRFVVTDGSTHEIRVFDASGKFVSKTGRAGQGPGEFGMSNMFMFESAGGNLLVEDNGNNRAVTVDAQGRIVATTAIQATSTYAYVRVAGAFGDGSWGAYHGGSWGPDAVGKMSHDSMQYLHYDAHGALLNKLPYALGASRFGHLFRNSLQFPYMPFTAQASYEVRGNRFYLMRGEASELELYSPDGRLVEIWRWTLPLRATKDVYERYKQIEIASAKPADRAREEDFFTKPLVIAPTLPSYQQILVDVQSAVWLERYRLPWESDRRWDIVKDGQWLGAMSMPPGFTPKQIGADFVLGIHRDGLGVERIRMYSLQRRVGQ